MSRIGVVICHCGEDIGSVVNCEAEAPARKLHVAFDKGKFFSDAHPKLRPVEAQTAGVCLICPAGRLEAAVLAW